MTVAVVVGQIRHDWPDSIDGSGILLFLAAIVLLPLIGYVLTALDLRAYMRALRGALVWVGNPARQVPGWLTDETPICLKQLGLQLPCSEAEVKEAYRQLAHELHPDRGGDVRRFLQLQQYHDQALHFLRQRAPDASAASSDT